MTFDTIVYQKQLEQLIKNYNFCVTDTANTYVRVVDDSLSNQHPASFPGGDANLSLFIRKNIEYPSISREYGVEGKVWVKFLVSENGQICNVTILKIGGYGLPEAALKLLRKMPQWTPATIQGKAVKCYYLLPVSFKIANQVIIKN
jgi:TonB family protein